MYSPGARAGNPFGTNFWCQQKALIILPIVAGLKKNALKSAFKYILFFMVHQMYIYITHGRPNNPLGTKFWWQQKGLSLCPYVASFKMISSKSDFIHVFNDFILVYSPGADNPLGTNFCCQQKALITSTICCKFQTNLFEFWFYAYFLMFFHMYIAPGQGQTTLYGQNPHDNRKALSLCPFDAISKNIFEVWFYS